MYFLKNLHWSIWLVLSLCLMTFLWTQMKSCHANEWKDRDNDSIRSAPAPIDSTALKAKAARARELEIYTKEALDFKDSWSRLGDKLNIRVDTTDLSLPEKGMELKLLEWINNKTNVVNKDSWFDFDRILFQSGSASVDPISQEQINNIFHILNSMPMVEIKIGGYTDNTGDPNKNQQLSQQRAEAIKSSLVTLGISAERISTEGYGAQHPVADNTTEEGRSKNRRIAIRVTKK